MAKPEKPTKSKAKRGSKAADKEGVSPRVARRERRRGQSREEIIEAARAVLVRDGIAATTLDAIAKEVGLTKAALYYYFRSKDALLFELIYMSIERQSLAISDAVQSVDNGGQALRAIIRETVQTFAPRLDDFRLAYLHAQVASPGSVKMAEEEIARIRPLNDMAFGGAAKLLSSDWESSPNHARVEPRMMAFLANIAAIGMLTIKGMVESVGDPLMYSDEQLIEGFARVFEAAAGSPSTNR